MRGFRGRRRPCWRLRISISCDALELQQGRLALRGAEGAPAAGSVGGYHPVAGHQDEDGVRLNGLSYGPGGAGTPRQQGHLAVADRLTGTGASKHLCHAVLEGRQIRQVQGDLPEILGSAGEVRQEPANGL